MAGKEIRTQMVQVPNQGLQIDSYLAEPVEEGTFPAVIVFQEIFGINTHIREVTERLAREGYVAIAPALYQRTAPGFDVGYSQEEVLLGRKYKEQTKAAEFMGDIQATIAYLKRLPKFQGDAIGCIGFCFGGLVAYLAATLPDIKATASFYGGGTTTWMPGGGEPPVSQTAKIHGVLYGFYGTQDDLIPNEQVDQIESALQQHQVQHRIFRYPTGHGFFCNHRASYNAVAAADAWEQVKELFRSTLKAS
ncbi:dienelactone hydrolase family protein [Kovacikia minuta CCNUW1]|uniref:dienelactone hydrolase family protein n=1 Tax=Kovacikia minuta TaxID=2931930 RepID=UPI001CCEED4B|nr:dienelactone hydrolase family protein [Kovacikia minuta]UBF27815.1 dienelactone hydrolase family protein [Kovacikia minuta CCNUW1]